MKEHILVSQMICYTGSPWRCEVSDWTPGIHDIPGVYIQFVEGCGYHVWDLTPDEAEGLAAILLKQAAKTRANFEKIKDCPEGCTHFCDDRCLVQD
jgi:hypothetical protein